MDLEETCELDKELSSVDSISRIKKVYSLSDKILMLTSGGAKYPVVPHLFKKALPGVKISILFIDIECYNEETYLAVNSLSQDGNEVKIYRPKISLKMDEALYGKTHFEKINEMNKEIYKSWCRRRKEEPLSRAINEIKPDFLAGGRTLFQSSKRNDIKCLEKRGSLFQFNPIFDWNDKKIFDYMKENNLSGNTAHFDPTKDYDDGECPIWFYEI